MTRFRVFVEGLRRASAARPYGLGKDRKVSGGGEGFAKTAGCLRMIRGAQEDNFRITWGNGRVVFLKQIHPHLPFTKEGDRL
jgi:hypothetical protein